MSDIQKIGVTLSEADLPIEPGGTAQLTVTLWNHQGDPDRLMLEVEGVDVEWYNIPLPAANVAPGASASARIVFRLARTSENRAGTYPFLVRVQAMETGEVGVAEAALHVLPFHAVQLELNPKREISTFFQPLREFDVAIANLGNTDETLDLYATDPEDGCAFEYDTDRVTLKPGQSQVVPLAARPRRMPWLGTSRLLGFTASARSVSDAYVSASGHGQLEARALVSPLLGIFLILAAFGSALAFYMLKPPPEIRITRFQATQKSVKEGEPVTLTWNVEPLDSQVTVQERAGGSAVDVNLPGDRKAVDSVTVTPQPKTTVYTLLVTHQGRKVSSKITIAVQPKPAAPKPSLEAFNVDKAKVHRGEPIILTWNGKNAREYLLDPGGLRLNQIEKSRTLTPDQDTTYTLRAVPLDDKYEPVMKSVKVQVVSRGVCIAEIKDFRAATLTPYFGAAVKLSWRAVYATAVRIKVGDGPEQDATDPRQGSKFVSVGTEPVTVTLVAEDSAGNTVSKALTLTPQERPASTPVDAAPADPNAPPADGVAQPGAAPPPGR